MIPVKSINQFMTGGFEMVKLNILNMENFLNVVNSCTGKVHMLCPDGRKVNINGEKNIQNSLWRQYLQNKNSLRIAERSQKWS